MFAYCSTQGILCLGWRLAIQIRLVFIDLRGCHGHHDDTQMQNYPEVKRARKDGQVITAEKQVHRWGANSLLFLPITRKKKYQSPHVRSNKLNNTKKTQSQWWSKHQRKRFSSPLAFYSDLCSGRIGEEWVDMQLLSCSSPAHDCTLLHKVESSEKSSTVLLSLKLLPASSDESSLVLGPVGWHVGEAALTQPLVFQD